MIELVRKKIIAELSKAEAAMMANSEEGENASGRHAALNALLAGGIPEELEQKLDILPAHWPQRAGWYEALQQFKGLIS